MKNGLPCIAIQKTEIWLTLEYSDLRFAYVFMETIDSYAEAIIKRN